MLRILIDMGIFQFVVLVLDIADDLFHQVLDGDEPIGAAEDLVEQIVGDIEDEHDELEDAHIYQDAKQGLVASARTPVKELDEHLGVKLLTPDEEEAIDTLGGLVFALVGRVPARGEIVLHASGIEFEVLDADPRRVKRLKIIDTRGRAPVGKATDAPKVAPKA